MTCRRPGSYGFRAGNPKDPRELVDPGPLFGVVYPDR